MASTVNVPLATVIAAAIMGIGSPDAAAQDASDYPLTNLQLFQKISAELAQQSYRKFRQADTATVTVSVLPREVGWAVEQSIGRALMRDGGRIVASHGAVNAEFGIADLHVSYDHLRREHFLGARVVDRTVGVTLHARITDTLEASPAMTEERTGTAIDTVEVSDLDRLEASTLRETHGVLPAEGFFENLAEPLIVLGTVAVAVVLLFTVRS